MIVQYHTAHIGVTVFRLMTRLLVVMGRVYVSMSVVVMVHMGVCMDVHMCMKMCVADDGATRKMWFRLHWTPQQTQKNGEDDESFHDDVPAFQYERNLVVQTMMNEVVLFGHVMSRKY